jgi:hypothetical protein
VKNGDAVVVRRWALASNCCIVCGGHLTGRIHLSGWERPFCAGHSGEPACSGCGVPVTAASGTRGPAPLCRQCRQLAILDQNGVRRVLPGIRADLDNLGVRLRSRTKVSLVSGHRLTQQHPGRKDEVSGLTMLGGEAAVEIIVREGLTLSQFGAVVAHETMHAFLFERGFRHLAPPSEEGMCEVLAYEWLRRRPGPLDRHEELRIARNPDPVYGHGFRIAQAAVDRLGTIETLRMLRRTGRIPIGP